MTTIASGDDSLASKCMAFCQALASQGKVFNFSLSVGPDFTFSLDTGSKAVTSPVIKKKASPSTLRRNARRRVEFIAKKQQSSPSWISSGDETIAKALKCDQCEYTAASEKGLKQHVRMKHKEPEKLRNPSSQSSLPVSPIRDQGRVEACHNCDRDMSPTHICEDPSQEEPVTCKYCMVVFNSEDEYDTHLCAPFKCDHCEEAFYTEHELENHSGTKLHTTNFEMQCDK